MQEAPQPSTYGQIKTFHQKLFDELLERDIALVDLFGMTLRMALLARYGSPEAIDQELGEGTYRAIQQEYGGLSSWRKAWGRVKRERKAQYVARKKALDAISEAVDQCMGIGIMDADILNEVQKMLTPPAHVSRWKPTPHLAKAK